MPDGLDLRSLDRWVPADPDFRAALRARLERELTGDPSEGRPDGLDEEDIDVIDLDSRSETERHRQQGGTRTRWLAAAAAAAAAVVASTVLVVGDGDDEADTATSAATATVLDERFDDDRNGWTDDPEAVIGGGSYSWAITPPGQNVVAVPAAVEHLTDVEIEAAVRSLDDGSAVGLRCRQAGRAAWFHWFRLSPSAGASIGVLPVADSADVPGVTLASDPAIKPPDAPFTIGARCQDVDGVTQLALLVDGEVVLRATNDEPLPAGGIGLEVQAGTGDEPSSVVWDDVVVRRLAR